MPLEYEIKFKPIVDLNDPEIRETLVKIEAFKYSTQNLPIPPILRNKFDKINIIRAVRGTTAIEGNPLNEEEIGKIIDSESQETNKDLANIEVLNAWKLYHYIQEAANLATNNKVSEGFIKEMHKITTLNCNYKYNVPGEYRSHRVGAGEYRAPDHNIVANLMSKFIDLLNSDEVVRFNPIIRALLAHFYLVTIHPFAEGNGRTSRGIEAYILYRGGYNIVGFYSLANFYYLNREEYINQLQDARFKYNENLTVFVRFSLKGYIKELEKVQNDIIDFYLKLSFRDYIGDLLRINTINQRIYNLLYNLSSSNIQITDSDLKGRQHPLIKAIFGDINERTLYRDLEIMREKELILIKDSYIVPNYDIMKKFMP